MDYIAIGRRIRALRKERRMTQERLAEQIERSVSFVGHIERGSRKMSIETLLAIADALEASIDTILGRDKRKRDVVAEAQELLELALKIAMKAEQPEEH